MERPRPLADWSFHAPTFHLFDVDVGVPEVGIELVYDGPQVVKDASAAGSSELSSHSGHVHELNLGMGLAGSLVDHVFELVFDDDSMTVTDRGLVTGGSPPSGEKAQVGLRWGTDTQNLGAANSPGSGGRMSRSDHVHAFAVGIAIDSTASRALALGSGVVQEITGVSGTGTTITVDRGIVTSIS